LQEKFNFKEEDQHHYSRKLRGKTEVKSFEEEPEVMENFLDTQSETDYGNVISSLKEENVEELNLFGLDIQQTAVERASQNDQVKKLIQNLVEKAVESQSGNQARKIMRYYDPFQESSQVVEKSLRYEEGTSLKASLVLDHFRRQAQEIDPLSLNLKDRELREQVLFMCENLKLVKVIDPHVLSKIYNIHRYK